ncbi:Mss4-like protein [Rhexocercosporidium sp. MPI-PUGE-AT-0058]|nr:Mss4-like protein [Rhexocercosporidium sp. MPI-PUGE-AT-0058]
MAATADTSKPFFPLAGSANDGWSKDDEATATCFCGAVQLSFPTKAPGYVGTFVCNCYDCRKITASMFATNFTIVDPYLKHVRGQENLKTFSEKKTIWSGKLMTNYFCSTCGTLMYRIGEAYPGQNFLRVGTVDDFSLHETKFRPNIEQFIKDRISWVHGVDGAQKFDAMAEL